MQKICKLCGKTKDLSEFYKKINSYENICKKCKYEKNKKNHKLICKLCGKEFYSSKKEQQFCSKKCRGEHQKHKAITKCESCGKEIRLTNYQIIRSKHHYCSNECRAIGVRMYQSNENNPNYKNATIEVKCSNCNKNFKILKCTTTNSDRSQKQNFYCSQKCKYEHQKKTLKGKSNPNYGNGYKIQGKLNPNYNFTKTYEERIKQRLYTDYYTWRNNVFKRDDYTCQCCGKRGGDLISHHLEGYNWCKKRRTDLDNGVTLCENCHKEFHKKYKCGNNTKRQYQDFIKNKKIKGA